MTAETASVSLDALDVALAAATPALDGDGRRLAAAVLRLLSAGEPVNIPAAARMPEPLCESMLRSWPAVFWDARSRVTGFWGVRDAPRSTRTASARGMMPAALSAHPPAQAFAVACVPANGTTATSTISKGAPSRARTYIYQRHLGCRDVLDHPVITRPGRPVGSRWEPSAGGRATGPLSLLVLGVERNAGTGFDRVNAHGGLT